MPYLHESLATSGAPLTENLGNSALTLVGHRAPAHGTLTIGTGPSWTYTPAPSFTGIDTFTLIENNAAAATGRARRIRVVVGPADAEAPSAPGPLDVLQLSTRQALLKWPAATDNYEVLKYTLYRDGTPIWETYDRLEYQDNTAQPGVTHQYAVTATDDAGLESAASATPAGAALSAQDDFEDGNYTTADPALTNGLAWTLVQGVAGVNATGKYLTIGSGNGGFSLLTSNQVFQPPFSAQFTATQQYVTTNPGFVLLYQDPANYYYLALNRSYATLFRVMDGTETQLAQSGAIRMNNTVASADFHIEVYQAAGALVFRVTRFNLTYGAEASVTWEDQNFAAAARFTQGKIGFVQASSTSQLIRFDNVRVVPLVGQGPDLDADGLLDAWEVAHTGGLGTAPDSDLDGDGFTLEEEYRLGTDPTKASSRFTAQTQPAAEPGTLILTWPSIIGTRYTLLTKPDLEPATPWTAVPGYEVLTATPPQNQATLPTNLDPQAYYQVQLYAE
jgi:hypothetical protein